MKKWEIAGLIIFVSLILYLIVGRNVKQSDLLENGKLINAKIISWTTPYKGGTVYTVFCEFLYNNDYHKLSSPTTYKGGVHDLIGRTFPGVFSPKKNGFEILITPEDFKKFNVSFPDSLEWVRTEEIR